MDNKDNEMNLFNTKRKCPNCRGELMLFPIDSIDDLKKRGILDKWTWYGWDTRIFGRIFGMEIDSQGGGSSSTNNLGGIFGNIDVDKTDITQEDVDNFFAIIGRTLGASINKMARSRNVRFCEKCNRVWDIFDETAFVLNSNNQELIQKYISLIEEDIPSGFIGDKELNWRRNLIKARLYQYQYKNQNDSQRNDDYDYYHLYLNALKDAEKYHTDNQNLLSYEYELKADMSDDTLEKFNLLNAALTSGISTHRKVRVQKNIGEIYSDVLDWWKLPISIEKPRIIFIANNLDDIAGFYDPTHSINHFFTIDRIPASIKFPYGGPTGNELYIANPVKPDEYVPYENYELALLMDKTRELKRLLRSLGATEITFTTLRGTKIEEAEKVGSSVNAEAGLLGHKVSGGYSSEDGQKRMSSQGIKVDYIERLNPYEYPSLPDRLHWYNRIDEWKGIVEARLHNNQLHFEQTISTKQDSSLNKQSQENINAAYENLIFHINANYDHKQEFHVKTNEETMWRITAEFKPLSEFENNQNTKSDKAVITDSSAEQEYIKAVKQLLEDGEISESDRDFLNIKRSMLGISEQRASELEKSLATQLTEGEQFYLKKYRKYAETGEITEMQRHFLDDIANTYGLSPERVKHLEAKN